jgi:hypothetical protein
MSHQAELFIEKHLARNVPLDFNACCERVRLALFEPVTRAPRTQRSQWHAHMISHLTDGEFSSDNEAEIGRELDEIQVRYLVVQKTLDLSVPVRPIFEELRSLRRWIGRAAQRLRDDDRDREVEFLRGTETEDDIPSGIDAFRCAASISERATIARQTLDGYLSEVEEMLEFFDYKNGLVTRGNISLFATKFAIHALADLFERTNTMGLKANVSETAAGGRRGPKAYVTNSRRYTGRFLEFATVFFQFVDPQQFQRNVDIGFQERVRKITKLRKRDPELFRKLYGAVAVEDVLEFMQRAEQV